MMAGRGWRHVGVGGTCECGSTDDVMKYEQRETGETRHTCINCEMAAASVKSGGDQP